MNKTKGHLANTRTVALTAVLALFIQACGITAPRGNDGFADLDSPGMADTDRTLSISLGPTVLRFAARFVDDDPEVRALLKSLDGVRVRIYEVTGEYERIVHNFQVMGNKLDRNGWDPVMLVREEDDLIRMYAKTSASGIQGLTILTADASEVVVVNVMGDIDPAYYSDVMVALNVEGAPDIEVVTVN